MNELFHITRFKLRSFLQVSVQWSAASLLKHAASIFIFGGFAVGAYFGAKLVTDYLLDSARLGLFLLHRFLSMTLFVFFLSINVGNIIVAYAALYRSPETAFYFTKPVSHTRLFVIKFIDIFFYSSTVFFIVAIAALLGYGSHFHFSIGFYFQMMFLMLIPFMLTAGCAAMVLLILLMRFSAVLGVRAIVGVLIVLYIGMLFGYFSATNPMNLVASVWQHYPNVNEYYGQFDPPFAQYLPNTWIADSLFWTIRGEHPLALSYTLLLVMGTGILFFTMVLVAKRYFYQSWLASLELQMSGAPRSSWLRVFSLTKKSKIEPQTSALLRKEIALFTREPSQWIHLAIIGMLVVTFIVSVVNIHLRDSIPLLLTVSYLTLFIFTAFLVASIALRFIYPLISSEGVNFWPVLTAPIGRKKIFRLKFLISIVPVFVVSEALALFSHRTYTDAPLLGQAAVVLMAVMSFALVGINLGSGAFFADFKEKNTIKIASSQSATLTFFSTMLYLVIVLAILFYPYSQYFGHIHRALPFEPALFWLAVGMVAAISLAAGFSALFAGERALRRDY